MIAALSGLMAGAVHVWSGPDHLAAVAPLAVRQRQRPWMHGVRWGFGHTTGVALVGLLSLWLRDWLPLELISSWGERLVGLLLIGIGFWALRLALRHNLHAHEHEHDGRRHVHIHVHAHPHGHEHPKAHQRHTHAAFGIGTLHGLAGSAYFLGVLPMLALPTTAQAVTYLFAFGTGTVLSMAGFSWLMGIVTARWAANSVKVYRGMLGACAAAAMITGVAWLTLNR